MVCFPQVRNCSSPTHATCPTHLIHFHLITRITFRNEYKMWSSSLQSLPVPCYPALLRPASFLITVLMVKGNNCWGKTSCSFGNVRCSLLQNWIINSYYRWSRGRVLVFGTQVRGFKPGRSRRTFQGEKILSTPSFGKEVKPFVPCRIFATCKSRMWKSQLSVEITGHFSPKVPPFTTRVSDGDTWRCK